jgi:hypothetical protein
MTEASEYRSARRQSTATSGWAVGLTLFASMEGGRAAAYR